MNWMTDSWLFAPAARWLSLLLASGVSVLILVYPHWLITADGTSQHGLLMILLFSISIAFVHGVGFTPKHHFWRFVLSPCLSWPPILWSLLTMLME